MEKNFEWGTLSPKVFFPLNLEELVDERTLLSLRIKF